MLSYLEKVEAYNQNPKACVTCNKELLLISGCGVKLSEILEKKFCNRSCAAKYTNRTSIKRNRASDIGTCEDCKQTLKYKRKPAGGLNKRRFCGDCVSKNRVIASGRNAIQITLRTKGDLFGSRKNWQSARTSIRNHAAVVIADTNTPKECAVCQYTNHVEVCHIRAVFDFDDETPIGVINSPQNLVYLCPNHHWEFDNQILKLSI